MKFEYQSPVSLRKRVLHGAPVDLVAVVLLTVVADLLVFALVDPSHRLLVALPLMFFLPGYALVSSLYPEAKTSEAHDSTRGISGIERAAMSFGLSLVVVPIVGLALWQAGLWLSMTAFAGALTLIVLVGATVGAIRRLMLPPARRFHLPSERWSDDLASGFGRETPAMDRLVNGALALSIVLAVGLLAFGMTSPLSGEAYTSAALLSENADGELVAAGYPTDFVAGESQRFALELTNHEGVAVQYTVVARLERVNTQGNDVTVVDSQVLDTMTVTVDDGAEKVVSHSVAPTMTGEQLRLSYYVYKDEAPSAVGADTAYRHLYVWISVSE